MRTPLPTPAGCAQPDGQDSRRQLSASRWANEPAHHPHLRSRVQISSAAPFPISLCCRDIRFGLPTCGTRAEAATGDNSTSRASSNLGWSLPAQARAPRAAPQLVVVESARGFARGRASMRNRSRPSDGPVEVELLVRKSRSPLSLKLRRLAGTPAWNGERARRKSPARLRRAAPRRRAANCTFQLHAEIRMSSGHSALTRAISARPTTIRCRRGRAAARGATCRVRTQSGRAPATAPSPMRPTPTKR